MFVQFVEMFGMVVFVCNLYLVRYKPVFKKRNYNSNKNGNILIQ